MTKRLIFLRGLNCGDVFGRGHVDWWNVVSMNEVGYNLNERNGKR